MSNDVVVEEKKSIFDPIFNIFAYPIASGLVRAIRAFITILIATLLAALADGSLFNGLSFIPAGNIPLITAILTPIFLGIDKWLRERGLQNEVVAEPTSGAANGPNTDEPAGNTDTDIPPPGREF